MTLCCSEAHATALHTNVCCNVSFFFPAHHPFITHAVPTLVVRGLTYGGPNVALSLIALSSCTWHSVIYSACPRMSMCSVSCVPFHGSMPLCVLPLLAFFFSPSLQPSAKKVPPMDTCEMHFYNTWRPPDPETGLTPLAGPFFQAVER